MSAQTTITELFASFRAAQTNHWGGGDNSPVRLECQPAGDTHLYAVWDEPAREYVIRSYGTHRP